MSAGIPLDRDHLRPLLQPVHIIGPQLHHLPSFIKVRCPIVSAAQRISYAVRQLMFDMFNTLLEYFVKDGPRRSSEAMQGLFSLDIPTDAGQRLARPRSSACWAAHGKGKHTSRAPSRQEFLEDGNGLCRKGNEVRLAHLPGIRRGAGRIEHREAPESGRGTRSMEIERRMVSGNRAGLIGAFSQTRAQMETSGISRTQMLGRRPRSESPR